MEERKNCWEFLKCGRGPGGTKINELGLCPAATQKELDGVNRGSAADRFCWTVKGTLCAGTFAQKFDKCLDCHFYKKVEQQEGSAFTLTKRQFDEQSGHKC